MKEKSNKCNRKFYSKFEQSGNEKKRFAKIKHWEGSCLKFYYFRHLSYFRFTENKIAKLKNQLQMKQN